MWRSQLHYKQSHSCIHHLWDSCGAWYLDVALVMGLRKSPSTSSWWLMDTLWDHLSNKSSDCFRSDPKAVPALFWWAALIPGTLELWLSLPDSCRFLCWPFLPLLLLHMLLMPPCKQHTSPGFQVALSPPWVSLQHFPLRFTRVDPASLEMWVLVAEPCFHQLVLAMKTDILVFCVSSGHNCWTQYVVVGPHTINDGRIHCDLAHSLVWFVLLYWVTHPSRPKASSTREIYSSNNVLRG